MRLSEIATGWYHYIVASASTKLLMKERLDICDRCEHKQQISDTGAVILNAINQAGSIYRCGICQCPCGPKAANPAAHCPLSKPKW